MPTIFEGLFGEETYSSQEGLTAATKILGSSTIKTGDAKTAAVGKKEERVSAEELENAYRADSFIFNAVNVAVQMIMSAGYKITAKKASVRKFFELFMENISKVGADTTEREIYTRIFQDNYIYGGGWNELVWNVGDDKIVDLKTLNPSEMDFARGGNGNIVLDENEKPVGYVQTLPYGINTTGLGDEAPEGVNLNGDTQIFIEAKRISYIPLYTYGAGFEGIGKVNLHTRLLFGN